jgi:tetratricopeptide (TPR) repeat protein
MKKGLRIVLVLVAVVGLVRAIREASRPGYEAHITGDAGVRAAMALADQGRCEKAIPIFEREGGKPLLEVSQGDLFEALGTCYLRSEPPEESGDPSAHQAKGHKYLGLAHQHRGDFEQAAAAFAKATRLDADDTTAHVSLGAAELARGRFAAAIDSLEQARSLDPRHAVARSNLALAYASVGRFRDADREAEQAARLGYPNVAKLKRLLAQAREDWSRGEGAR